MQATTITTHRRLGLLLIAIGLFAAAMMFAGPALAHANAAHVTNPRVVLSAPKPQLVNPRIRYAPANGHLVNPRIIWAPSKGRLVNPRIFGGFRNPRINFASTKGTLANPRMVGAPQRQLVNPKLRMGLGHPVPPRGTFNGYGHP